MRYTVVVNLKTDRLPQDIIDEIVSILEFEVATRTVVTSAVVVRLGDSTELAVYKNEEP